MAKLRQYVALTVVLCLALLAAGWFLLISPKRATAEEVRTQTAATVATTEQLRSSLAILKTQAQNLPQQQAKLDAASAKLPAELGMPDLLRLLSATATSSGVTLLSVSPSALTPVAAPVAAVAAAAAPDGAAATDGAAKPAPAAGAAPGATAAAPGATAAGAGTLNAVTLSMTVVGSYVKTQQFLAALEDLPRALRVTSLTIAPGGGATAGAAPSGTGAASVPPGTPGGTDAAQMSSSITGQVFVAVGRTPPAPVVLPGDKGGRPAPTPAPPAGEPGSTATASAPR